MTRAVKIIVSARRLGRAIAKPSRELSRSQAPAWERLPSSSA